MKMKKLIDNNLIFGLGNIIIIVIVAILLQNLMLDLRVILGMILVIQITMWFIFGYFTKNINFKKVWICNIVSIIIFHSVTIIADPSALIFLVLAGVLTLYKLTVDIIISFILFYYILVRRNY